MLCYFHVFTLSNDQGECPTTTKERLLLLLLLLKSLVLALSRVVRLRGGRREDVCCIFLKAADIFFLNTFFLSKQSVYPSFSFFSSGFVVFLKLSSFKFHLLIKKKSI